MYIFFTSVYIVYITSLILLYRWANRFSARLLRPKFAPKLRLACASAAPTWRQSGPRCASTTSSFFWESIRRILERRRAVPSRNRWLFSLPPSLFLILFLWLSLYIYKYVFRRCANTMSSSCWESIRRMTERRRAALSRNRWPRYLYFYLYIYLSIYMRISIFIYIMLRKHDLVFHLGPVPPNAGDAEGGTFAL